MAAGSRVLAGVTVRRRIAAERDRTSLAGAQVHPLSADLHTLVALPVLRVFHRRDALEVRTGCFRHHRVLSSAARSHFARSAAASYVLCRNSIKVSRGDEAVRMLSYGRRNSPSSLL